MKRFGLFVLPIVCLVGCNKGNNPTPIEKTLSREQLFEILPASAVKEIRIANIEASWDNKTQNETVQKELVKLGATNEYKGTNTITNIDETNNIRRHESSKQILCKASLETYFPIDAGEYTYKIKDYDIIIEVKGDVAMSYTYMASNGVVKSFTRSSKLNNIDYTITDTFNYSYI